MGILDPKPATKAELTANAAPTATGTDDTAALQAAINTATAAGKALVLKPNAVYLVSDTITVGTNANIDGRGATIKAKTGMNKTVLTNQDPVNGNTNITIRDLKIDGNGTNQTTQFTAAVMTKVTYSKFYGLDVQGGLRNQQFPNGTYGEGFSLVYSHYNEVIGGRFHNNTYDGLKLRSSNWNRISNVLCEDNGRSGIQISFFSPTGPPYNVGENVEAEGSNNNVLENIIVRHSTGTPHSAAPTTSGIYFHTAARNIIKGFQIEGVQQGIGFWGTCSDNSLSDGLILHRYGSTLRAGIDCENGTEYRNTFSNIKVRGMSGANGKLVNLISGATDNRFLSCVFEQGAGTGTWTISNAGTGTQFLDYTTALAVNDAGTSSVIRDAKGGSSASTTRKEYFNAGTAAVPYGWTTRWNQTGATWTEDAAGYLRLTKTGTGRAALAYNLAGDQSGTTEVLTKVRTSSAADTSTFIGTILRGSGAQASENGYYAALVVAGGATRLQVLRYTAGAGTDQGSTAATWTANAWYWLRSKVVTASDGSVFVFVRIWADGANEPTAWTLTVNDTSANKITTPGFIGLFGFAVATMDVDSFTYAANAGIAPTP